MRKNLKAYNKVSVETNLLEANPHQVILMMYDGLLKSIAIAKGAIERKDLALKSESITKALDILSALRHSLDFNSEPKISQNFDELYAYCIDRLVDISVSLDSEAIDEITTLLKPIRDAWFEMPEAAKQAGFTLLQEKEQAEQVQQL